MPKKVVEHPLSSKANRRSLPERAAPYWRDLSADQIHLGYVRRGPGAEGEQRPGVWVVRAYRGKGTSKYRQQRLGIADDLPNASGDGQSILNYDQAVSAARRQKESWAPQGEVTKGRYTVAKAMEAYLSYLREHKKTAAHAEKTANAFILPKFGAREISSLTTEELQGWIHKLAKQPARIRTATGKPQRFRELSTADQARKRKASANRIWTTFKAALNRARRAGRVRDDAIWRAVEGFHAVERPRVDYLMEKEARALIQHADPDFKNLVQAALLTGCRYGELMRLAVGDFDERRGQVIVLETKSGDPRFVALSHEGVAFFTRLCRGRKPSETMLLKTNGAPWKPAHQKRPMAEACKRASISPKNFHALRHTYATLGIENGTPPFVIAKNLGHADQRMVERHYGNISNAYIVEQIRAHAPNFGISKRYRAKTS